MARRRSAIDADLDAVYAEIPDARCKGLCVEACGPILLTGRERARIAERSGVEIPDGVEGMRLLAESANTYRCPALDAAGRCVAYDVRPLVCRLYGATDGVPALDCGFGCRPTEPLPATRARELVHVVEAIAGAPY